MLHTIPEASMSIVSEDFSRLLWLLLLTVAPYTYTRILVVASRRVSTTVLSYVNHGMGHQKRILASRPIGGIIPLLDSFRNIATVIYFCNTPNRAWYSIRTSQVFSPGRQFLCYSQLSNLSVPCIHTSRVKRIQHW